MSLDAFWWLCCWWLLKTCRLLYSWVLCRALTPEFHLRGISRHLWRVFLLVLQPIYSMFYSPEDLQLLDSSNNIQKLDNFLPEKTGKAWSFVVAYRKQPNANLNMDRKLALKYGSGAIQNLFRNTQFWIWDGFSLAWLLIHHWWW